MSSESDTEDEISRPRGRIAKRMLPNNDEDSETGGHSEDKFADLVSAADTNQSRSNANYGKLQISTPIKNREERLNDKAPSQTSPLPTPSPNIANKISPTTNPSGENEDSGEDEELPDHIFPSKQRLAELVAQKRTEREAKEAETERQRRQREAEAQIFSSNDDGGPEIEDTADWEIDRIMSDAARPARAASKKALLEMERETQRLAREQALAHKMKVRKKFPTSELFAKFEFRPTGEADQSQAPVDMNCGSSVPNSDASEPRARQELVSTPPSSPPTPWDRQRALVDRGALDKLVLVREDSLATLANTSDEKLLDAPDAVYSMQKAQAYVTSPAVPEREQKKGLRLARFGKAKTAVRRDDSSDSDLEIVYAGTTCQNIFDRAKSIVRPRNEDSKAIYTLKHLSNFGADTRKFLRNKKGASRPSVHPQLLESQLRVRAKEQAHIQQLERIAELKSKGIVVLSAEDREKEAEAYENLLEKAREEAENLRKAEKAAAQESKDADEAHAEASADETEDEDYEDESRNENDELENDMVNASADETEDDQSSDDEETEFDQTDALPKDLALLERHKDKAKAIGQDLLDDGLVVRVTKQSRRSRVIKDDEDEDENENENDCSTSRSEVITAAQPAEEDEGEKDPFAAFGFSAGHATSSLMSPTQVFNATMQTPTQATPEYSLNDWQHLAAPAFSLAPVPFVGNSQDLPESQASFIPNSQMPESQRTDLGLDTHAPATPMQGIDTCRSSLDLDTPDWVPTQDDGHKISWGASGLLGREDTLDSSIDHETQSTVPLRTSASPVPMANIQARHRYIRRQRVTSFSDEENEDDNPALPQDGTNAFRVMARRRLAALSAAEKTDAQREAKNMMDEQAEESEDEYAGLGGDDYVAPETAEDRDIIDSSHVDVDERALAAHFAEQERVRDEANASKLYKDLVSGNLRRKQAGMFGLDDEEDDLALRRRQMRQREETRRRKLLLQDDNIANLAEGKPSKGKDAFLKAIADDDGDEDMACLSDSDAPETAPATQTDCQLPNRAAAYIMPLQEITGNKRRHVVDSQDELPRIKRQWHPSAFRAPSSLIEVRKSVSFLLDDPSDTVSNMERQDVSDSEDDAVGVKGQVPQREEYVDETNDDDIALELARNNDGGFAPNRDLMPPPRLPAAKRRTAARPAVVDRLSLKRSASDADRSTIPKAWAAPGGSGCGVPTLLRRATTNTAFAANERGVTTSNGLSRENSSIKSGGSKKSSLAYQTRAEERRAIIEASTKRRAENTARIAQMRRTASTPLGRGLSGQFELQ